MKRLDFVFSRLLSVAGKGELRTLDRGTWPARTRIIALLQHSKILVIETTDGQSYVCESGANLSSCASLENLAIFNDPDLAAFHKGWIDSLFPEPRQ